jgi:hypothetical protein
VRTLVQAPPVELSGSGALAEVRLDLGELLAVRAFEARDECRELWFECIILVLRGEWGSV